MSFHLGKPILVMLISALAAGVVVWARPDMPQTKYTVWTFAESHKRSYSGDPNDHGEPPAHKYTRLSGNSLDVVLINGRAEDTRLMSIFNTHGRGQFVPDAVEMEISKIGKFFRPPLSEIGFLPLNDFLKRSGWYDKIVKERYAPYSKKGVIFGLPHDLHPTTITYRKDLYDEAGVDLAAAKTWPEFREAGLKFRRYWQSTGRPRWAAGMTRVSSDNIVILLQQCRINLVDDENRIFLNDPKVAKIVRAYADMVAGPEPIGTDFNPAPGMNYQDLANGDVCAMFTPDWIIGYLKQYAAKASGKLAMMALPIFEPGDCPTATWGGTMIGIPRDCRDPEEAWKIIEMLYLDHESIDYRRQTDQIIPPIRAYWNDPVYQEGDPYFMNSQNVNKLYIELADQIPMRYVTPFTVVAQWLLSDVLNQTVARIDAGDTQNLDRDIQAWLDQSAKDLARRIEFGTFED